MRKTTTAILAALLFGFLVIADANAQEENRIGVMMVFPAAVGLNWELSQAIAFRPDFSFSRTTNSISFADARSPSDSNSKSFTAGVSAVIYIQHLSPLRVYVS